LGYKLGRGRRWEAVLRCTASAPLSTASESELQVKFVKTPRIGDARSSTGLTEIQRVVSGGDAKPPLVAFANASMPQLSGRIPTYGSDETSSVNETAEGKLLNLIARLLFQLVSNGHSVTQVEDKRLLEVGFMERHHDP